MAAVRVKGLRETQRAFQKLEKSVAKEVRDELKAAAEPVAAAWRDKVARYVGASVATIRPRASVRGAFVTQNARKVTGRRGDFGSLQMRRGDEALEENQNQVVTKVERMLDRLSASQGF